MLRKLPVLARAHARLHVVPRGVERSRAAVVDLVGIAVDVQIRGGVHELEPGQGRRARLPAKLVERRVQVTVRAPELLAEGIPAGAIGFRVAREHGRQRRVGHLEWVAGDDAHPAAATGGERRERDDVVLDDHVGVELVDDLEQAPVHVARAVAERLERRCDELAELLDRGLAEDRGRVVDEVDPELPGHLLLLRRRAEAHEPLLESTRLERAGERLLEDEDDAVPALAQHGPDAGAVVGRPVGALREEDDRRHRPQPAPGSRRSSCRSRS